MKYPAARLISILTTAVVAWLGSSIEVPAQAPYPSFQASERWAWDQIRQRKAADFNAHCNTPALDPRAENEPHWTERCRLVSAAFLVNVLTDETWLKQVPFSGVRLIGARISGDIDLKHAKLDRVFLVTGSRIDNNVNLDAARTESDIGFVASRIAGGVSAQQLQSKLSLVLQDSEFEHDVSLQHAKIDGNVDMSGATFHGDINAGSLQVGAHLLMRPTKQNKAQFKGVKLNSANIGGQIDMRAATFDGMLDALSLQVGSQLILSTPENKSLFTRVRLSSSKIGGYVRIEGATFKGDLIASAIRVSGSLFIRPPNEGDSVLEGVALNFARVSGDLYVTDVTLRGALDAEALQVQGSARLQRSVFHQKIDMTAARVGSNLEIDGTKFAELDLSGASVGGDFVLGRPGEPAVWIHGARRPSKLNLHNTRVANLVDTKEAWPTKENLSIQGFTFGRLGGHLGESASDMRTRGMRWWDDWARRDPVYSPTPYEQLAAALVATGDRDAADEIRYLGRVRQREDEKNWAVWIFTGFVQYVAGFGIGGYTFLVLVWVVGITLGAAAYLWKCVPAATAHGPAWCFGASLNRLLPIIEINKEFSEFFHDPKRERLTGFQSFVFSILAVVGWVLGLILLAAISGVTQRT